MKRLPRATLAGLACIATALASPPLRADELPSAALAPAQRETEEVSRYRMQLFKPDAISGGLLLVGLGLSGFARSGSGASGAGTALIVSGSAGLALGAPAVHAFGHGRWGIGFADLGLRVALPLAGLGLGFAAAGGGCLAGQSGCSNSGPTGALVGLAVGSAAALILDYALFARPPDDAAQRAQVAPAVMSAERRPAVGLAGRF